MFACLTPDLRTQMLLQAIQGAIFAPASEVSVQAIPMRQVMGQGSPCAADAQMVKDAVEKLAIAPLMLSSAR